MQNYYYDPQLKITLAITLITTGCFAQLQPASAQLAELTTEAINTLNNVGQKSTLPPQPPNSASSPQPSIWGNSDFHVGTDNLSGNTINLCISGCIPHSEPVIESPYPSSRTHLPIHFERL